MANTLNLGTNGNWATKEGSVLGYNSENNNYKPLAFSFSRDSSATVINKDGLIETVGSGEPRIDFKDNTKGALLLEPSRTNRVTYSEDFSNSAWNKSGVSVTSGFLSPDGTTNAYKMTENTSNSVHKLQRISGVSNSFQIQSIFVKYDNSQQFIQTTSSRSSFNYVNFDILNKTFTNFGTSVGKIIELSNGWLRLEVYHNSSTTVYWHFITSLTAAWSESYLGNGKYLLIYGAQVEQGSYATSYIPTSGSAVTRVADSCLKDDINTSIINSSYPFSMYAEATYIDGNSHVLSFSKRVVSNNYYVISITGNNQVLLDARANGSTELIESGVTLVDGQKFKAAITMESATSGKICVNGNTVVSKTNFSNQAVNNQINDLLLGQLRVHSDTGDRLPLSDVKLYNTVLTDQELIALTS